MMHGGEAYTRMFGWPEPFADGAQKRERYAEGREATNRRMTDIFDAALDRAEAGQSWPGSAWALGAAEGRRPAGGIGHRCR